MEKGLEKIIAGNIVNGVTFFLVGLIPPYPYDQGISSLNYAVGLGLIGGTTVWKANEYLQKWLTGSEPTTKFTWEEAAMTSPGAMLGYYAGCTLGTALFR